MTFDFNLTEAEWLSSKSQHLLLYYYLKNHKITRTPGMRRRLRLTACAYCRRAWHLMNDRVRAMLELAERGAEGKARRLLKEAMWEFKAYQDSLSEESKSKKRKGPRTSFPDTTVQEVLAEGVYAAAYEPYHVDAVGYASMRIGKAFHLWGELQGGPVKNRIPCDDRWQFEDTFRDIFWPPHRPLPTLDPVWLAYERGRVKQIAQVIYNEHRWDELPVLADALEDAGCSDADLLTHCRATKFHARGCWAVDLILGIT